MANKPKGWRHESARHGLAAKGIKTGNLEPLKFVEPVNRLHRLAKKYQPGITKEEVLFRAKANPAMFFYGLTGEMPLNPQTRKDADKLDKLALEVNLGRKVD